MLLAFEGFLSREVIQKNIGSIETEELCLGRVLYFTRQSLMLISPLRYCL